MELRSHSRNFLTEATYITQGFIKILNRLATDENTLSEYLHVHCNLSWMLFFFLEKVSQDVKSSQAKLFTAGQFAQWALNEISCSNPPPTPPTRGNLNIIGVL